MLRNGCILAIRQEQDNLEALLVIFKALSMHLYLRKRHHSSLPLFLVRSLRASEPMAAQIQSIDPAARA